MTIKKIFETMEYGPAPESRDKAEEWLQSHDKQLKMFIDGKWIISKENNWFKSISPGDNLELCEIAEGTKEDVDNAVKAAKTAFPIWRALSGHERARYLYAIARQIQKHARLFAVLESLDNGKPIRETRDYDIPIVIRHFYHHAGWAQLMETELSDYEPIGVVGAITPWNFPLMLFSWKVAPALAMGNTIVVKPAKLTSITAILFAEICKIVDLPPGVLNIVLGSGNTVGEAIINHLDIKKISFTGSTEVGKHIRRSIAGTGKKLTLELGGKSPFIVFEDADIESAIEGVVNAIWFNQGQVCCAGSRLLIQESIYDKFVIKLKNRMEKLRIGHPLDKSIDIGAIVDKNQWEIIDNYVKLGIKEGGKLHQPKCEIPENGFYYPPTIFTNVSPANRIVLEEIFGPILVILSFRSHNEAVELANNSVYGLAASIWSENINMALHVAPLIKAGTVWINCTNVFDAASGFGGYKESGFGREGGKEGLYDYLQLKFTRKLSNKPIHHEIILPTNEDKSKKGTIDRTAKLYIGGKQVRPDGNYSVKIYSPNGTYVGEVAEGNRKDIRNAVEAARNSSWKSLNVHTRAQILYYIAENLIQRSTEFCERIMDLTGCSKENATKEVNLSIQRIFYYAAYSDKHDGVVHKMPNKYMTLAINEPIGTIGIICPDEKPLLSFISTIMPALAMGNEVVVIPSSKYPLIATDLYQVFETSDVPAGSVNIITGDYKKLIPTLAEHFDVDGIWYFAEEDLSGIIEKSASDNMKRSWLSYNKFRNWEDNTEGQGVEFILKACEVKNVWLPYGE
jgi:aldehyde dehydrogenase (NAD+)